MGTGVQTEAEIDKLMEMTDPNLVYLLYDSGHLVCSGEDHIRILKKYINRIKHVHLKDVRKELVEKVKNENMSFLDGVRMGMFTVQVTVALISNLFLIFLKKTIMKVGQWLKLNRTQQLQIHLNML